MLKAAAVAITGSFIALLLKKTSPEFAMLTVLSAGLIVLSYFLSCINNAVVYMQGLRSYYKIPVDLMPVLKAVGASCVTQITANFCRDCEQTAMASKVELAGNAVIILISLPVMKNILDLVYEVL